MRIVANTDGRLSAVRRLAAIMLNYELGAEVYDETGQQREPPHALCPMVVAPPATAAGFPREYHLRPAVGVVYYALAPGRGPAQLAQDLKRALAAYGVAHLRGYRSAEAVPSASLRLSGAAGPRGAAGPGRYWAGSAIEGPRAPRVRPEPGERPCTGPARVLLYAPAAYRGPPPHVSYHAAFTWVLLALPAAFGFETLRSFADLNAVVAGVVYDEAGALAPAPAAPLMRGLRWDDLVLPSPPADAGEVRAALNGRVLLLDLAPAGTAPEYGAAVVVAPCVPEAHVARRELEAKYPAVEWAAAAAEGAFGPGGAATRCVSCGMPLWGDVFLLSGLEFTAAWRKRTRADLPVGAPLFGGPARAAPLCRFCFEAASSDRRTWGTVGGRVRRTYCPVDQATAFSAAPDKLAPGKLAPLAALTRHGSVRPLGDAGAFVLGVGPDAVIVVCGHCVGGDAAGDAHDRADLAERALRLPSVLAERLPILWVALVAEVR